MAIAAAGTVPPVETPADPAPPTVPARPVLAPVVAGAIGLGVCATMGVVDPTGGPTICPFRAATGLACPGCGTTRMLHHLMLGDVGRAFALNPLAFVVLPFVAWWLFASATAAFGGPRWRTPHLSTRATWVLAAVVLAFWVLRNLPVAPFTAFSAS